MADKTQTEADGVSFIHSSLDDAGLSAAEFRVFCKISRVGDFYRSVPNMAADCRLHPDTVWEALSRLIELGMIVRKPRPGTTSVYKVLPPSNWITPTGNGGVSETEGRPSKPGGTHRKLRGNHPPETEGHKVTPIEVTPIKAIPTITPVASNLEGVKLTPQGRRTAELMERCKEVFGEAEMKNPDCHQRWLQLAVTDPDRLSSVLESTALKHREDGLATPAAYATSLLKYTKPRSHSCN